MEALKQYNSGKAMWCIPKKGSPEYFDVRALMNHDSAKDIEARNVERREKSVAQLREATKHMKPGVREDDYEAMNAERRSKSVAQLREATKHMKPGVRVDEPPKGVKAIVKAIEAKLNPDIFTDSTEGVAFVEILNMMIKSETYDDGFITTDDGNAITGNKENSREVHMMLRVMRKKGILYKNKSYFGGYEFTKPSAEKMKLFLKYFPKGTKVTVKPPSKSSGARITIKPDDAESIEQRKKIAGSLMKSLITHSEEEERRIHGRSDYKPDAETLRALKGAGPHMD